MWQDLSASTNNFDLVTSTLTFDLLLKKLNLGYNLWTEKDKALILHNLCGFPCDKTFLFVPNILTLWPRPWLLTYFWKNLTLAKTFEQRKIRLWYYIIYVGSLWQDFSVRTKHFDFVTLPLTFDLLLKKLNLGYNLWTERDKALILAIWIPCDKTFLFVQKNFDFETLTLTFDLDLKKLNLEYNFWAKRDRVFILHIWVPCGKTFLFVSIILTVTLTFDLLLTFTLDLILRNWKCLITIISSKVYKSLGVLGQPRSSCFWFHSEVKFLTR